MQKINLFSKFYILNEGQIFIDTYLTFKEPQVRSPSENGLFNSKNITSHIWILQAQYLIYILTWGIGPHAYNRQKKYTRVVD